MAYHHHFSLNLCNCNYLFLLKASMVGDCIYKGCNFLFGTKVKRNIFYLTSKNKQRMYAHTLSRGGAAR